MSIDPSNGLKFWGIGEYFNASESACHAGRQKRLHLAHGNIHLYEGQWLLKW